ncbi:uncharacterized protein [Narcine bancroftii]|uniref:uncharacterized protein isoform X3 n=1 Tax=Narcine bancroftii TaxID=1343680 RepID=UPI0038312AB8
MMRNCSGAPRASAEGKEEDAAFASGLQGRGGGLCLGTAAERRHPCKMLPTGACHLLGGQVLCKVAEPFKRPDGCDLFPSRCDAATFQLTSRRLSLLETPHLKGHPEHRQLLCVLGRSGGRNSLEHCCELALCRDVMSFDTRSNGASLVFEPCINNRKETTVTSALNFLQM